ncbi:hypothetical protein HMPREF1257_01809, partial [Corynebacterium sp. KPL1814]
MRLLLVLRLLMRSFAQGSHEVVAGAEIVDEV